MLGVAVYNTPEQHENMTWQYQQMHGGSWDCKSEEMMSCEGLENMEIWLIYSTARVIPREMKPV